MLQSIMYQRLRNQSQSGHCLSPSRIRLAVGTAGALLVALSACTFQPAPEFCESEAFLIDQQFDGGAFASCEFTSANAVDIVITPEDSPPINPSPWYAFRVSPKFSGRLTARVSFSHAGFRYWPKLSRDGRHWRRAEEADVLVQPDGEAFELSLQTDAASVWVSAQELYTARHYWNQLAELATTSDARIRILGLSVQGRPLFALETPAKSEVVILLGRQHPPEVSGAMAMTAFVETLLAETELARRFRERYSLLILPLMNPDGVALGHWRHNVNGVDLNRDWRDFSQPETAAVLDELERIEQAGRRPALMLDFHSTRQNLFYTQLEEDSSWPIDFASVWFERVSARNPEVEFEHAKRQRSGQANTKNYFFDRYRIPALTYELGDEASRELLRIHTPMFAEEMMRLMLEYTAAEQTQKKDGPPENQE